MNDWNDEEVTLLSRLLDDLADKEYHYPNDYSEADKQTSSSLREKVRREAKQRRFWWAQ